MDTYRILDADDITKLCNVYNVLKNYCLTKDFTRWTVGHVQFSDITTFSAGCWFDVLSKCDQEPLGKCTFSIDTRSPDTSFSGYMIVSFNTYKEDIDEIGNVYPKVILPLSRYEVIDDVLGRYFYRLIHNLYTLAVFY